MGFLLPRTQLRRVPRVFIDSAREPRRRARIAKPSPVPSSGFLPLSTVQAFSLAARTDPLRNPPFAVAPDASRPCFMPLASLELPSRAFPSRRAVPALAGLLLPCGYRLRFAAGAEPPGVSRSLSPPRQLFARTPLPEEEAGRMSRDSVSLRSLGQPPRHARKHACSNCPSRRHWARRVSDRHARFEALLPSGVRSRFGSVAPARAEPASRCSPGLLLL